MLSADGGSAGDSFRRSGGLHCPPGAMPRPPVKNKPSVGPSHGCGAVFRRRNMTPGIWECCEHLSCEFHLPIKNPWFLRVSEEAEQNLPEKAADKIIDREKKQATPLVSQRAHLGGPNPMEPRKIMGRANHPFPTWDADLSHNQNPVHK